MTLKEVAVLAGCSVATVSKALKNSPEISEAVKARVVAVAKESGYLKKATTHQAVLGGMKLLLVSDARGTALPQLSALQATAKKQGLTLLYVSLAEREARDLMAQIGAMGLLLAATGKTIREERVCTLAEDPAENDKLIRQIGEYRPRRPSRAGAASTRLVSPQSKVEEPTVAATKKEEIWLL